MTQHNVPPTGGTQTPPPPAPGASFFGWLRSLNLVRTDEGWVAGVCSGIARRTNLDPLIIRGIVIVVAIFGGPAVFLYALAWLLVPDTRGKIHLEQVFRGVVEGPTIAIGVIMLISFFPAFQGLWWAGPPGWWGMPDWLELTFRLAWGALITGGIIWLIVVIAQRAQRDGWGRGYRGPDAPNGYPYYGPDGTRGGAPAETGTDQHPSAAAGASSAPHAAGFTSTGAYPPRDAEWHAAQEEKNRQRQEARAQRAQQWQAAASHQGVAFQAERDEYRRRRPGAAFVSIFLGLALVAGALTAAVAYIGMPYLGFSSLSLSSSGSIAVGAAVALAVVGLGVVVAGIRGRHSSGLGFASFCLIVATLIFGVFPTGTQFMPFGAPTWHVSSAPAGETQGFVLIGGNATLDLTELDSREDDNGGDVSVWLGGGVTRVILPATGTFVVESNAFAGSVNYSTNDGNGSSSGALISERTVVRNGDAISSSTTVPDDATTVRLWYAAGTADISIDN